MSEHETSEVHDFMDQLAPAQQAQLARWGLQQAGLLVLMSACYGRCFFCAHEGVTAPPPELVTPWQRVVDYLGSFRHTGMTELCLGGTEPSTHPDFRRTLLLARKAGVQSVQLMTSGVTLARHAPRWRELGVTSVVVPLYAADAPTHDAIVGVRGHHAAVLEGLHAAAEAGITPHVHSLAMRRTIAGLPHLARWLPWGPLHIAPLRPKDHVFSFAPEAIDPEDLAPLADTDAHLIGFPACWLPQLSREAPLLLALYFRGQARHRVAGCGTCTACEGVPDGWPEGVTPR